MANEFQIRIISLKNQVKRRRQMSLLFSDSDCNWDFFDAIPGKEIAPFLNHYDRLKRLRFPGHDLTPNEIACFISHREVWKQCVDAGNDFLILEDDAYVLHKNFHVEQTLILASEIRRKVGDKFLVRLGNGGYRKDFLEVSPLSNQLSIVRYKKDPLCALAYMVSPSMATELIKNSERFFLPVDDYMWNLGESGALVLDIEPACFYAAVEDNPSTIGDRKKSKMNLFGKIKREINRAIYMRNLRRIEEKALKEVKQKRVAR